MDTTILKNASVAASGSCVVKIPPAATASLNINVAAATGTITFSVQQVDPVTRTALIGTATTGATISGALTQQVSVSPVTSSYLNVSWTVTGGGATGVSATMTTALSSGSGGSGTPATNAPKVLVYSNLGTAAFGSDVGTGAKNLRGFALTHGVTNGVWVFFYDAAAAPADGAVGSPLFAPIFCYPNGPNAIGESFFSKFGLAIATGISYVLSSTVATLTRITSADMASSKFTVLYDKTVQS